MSAAVFYQCVNLNLSISKCPKVQHCLTKAKFSNDMHLKSVPSQTCCRHACMCLPNTVGRHKFCRHKTKVVFVSVSKCLNVYITVLP